MRFWHQLLEGKDGRTQYKVAFALTSVRRFSTLRNHALNSQRLTCLNVLKYPSHEFSMSSDPDRLELHPKQRHVVGIRLYCTCDCL